MAYDSYIDLTYGDDTNQLLNIYVPEGASDAIVVVFVHGGAWRFGRKERDIADKITYFTDKGAIFVTIDYPQYPESPPINQSVKVADSIAWLKTNIPTYGGSAAKIIMVGHSSGAHVVALIATKLASRQVAGSILLDTDAYDIVKIMASCYSNKSWLYAPFGTDTVYWEIASPARGPETPDLFVISSVHRSDRDNIVSSFVDEFSADYLAVSQIHSATQKDIGVDIAYSDLLWDWIVTKT